MPEEPPAPQESLDAGRGWFARVRRSRLIAGVVWTAEQAGKLAILVTIVNYFLEAPDRLKSKEFQAWQLVNSARTGDGGRKLALHDLVLEDVDLSGLVLDGANLFGADFRGGAFSGVSFVRANLNQTDFSCRPRWRLRLLRRDCKPADLNGAIFTAPLGGASFRTADLSFARFSTPGAPDEVQRGAGNLLNFSHARLYAADFHDIDLDTPDFSDAYLERTQFSRVKFLRASFERADLRRRPGPGSTPAFDGVSFAGVSFAGADLTGATFSAALVEPLPEDEIMNTMLCSDPSCEQRPRPLTEDDLKGARLCKTVINGRRSDRDCAAAEPDDWLLQ